MIYYSGHGHRIKIEDSFDYYLLPYDTPADDIELGALPATQFAQAIRRLNPKRLLVILDCCQAGGIDVKHAPLTWTAPPTGLFVAEGDAKAIDNLSKGVETLDDGEGRAVLLSSKGAEPSYIRRDGQMSLFTYHLIEALTGHAAPQEGARQVLVSDLLGHVHRHVPQSAAEMGCDQHPQVRTTGNFAVAMLLGGAGVPKGQAAPDPLTPPSAQPATLSAANGGVNVGGNAENSTIVTGDGNQVVSGNNNQLNQVNTGGGNFVRGNVGEYVQGNKTVQGDEVHGDKFTGDKFTGDKFTGDKFAGDKVIGDKVMGDKVGGDSITTGNISGSTVAIGRNARATSNQTSGLSGADLEAVLAPLRVAVGNAPAEVQTAANAKVAELKAEVEKGKQDDDGHLASIVEGLVGLVPNAVSAVVQAFASPILAGVAGPATNYVLRKLRGQ